MATKRHTYQVLIEKLDDKRSLGKHRHRPENNIKINQRNRMGGCGLDSSVYEQGPVSDSCEHGNELLGSIKNGGISLPTEQLLASLKGLSNTELDS
jgi:hypothetical protein